MWGKADKNKVEQWYYQQNIDLKEMLISISLFSNSGINIIMPIVLYN